MQTTLNYHYLRTYLPVRYSADFQQQQNRREVYNFKDGKCSSELKRELINEIRDAIGYSKYEWIVCFIPASTYQRTMTRYSEILTSIKNEIGVDVTLNAIQVIADKEPGHNGKKESNPASNYSFNNNLYRGKKVLLIDDVITRGTTFKSTAIKLLESGAKDVKGLFIAKTVWN
jgi:predicted amidophosphoribosyltransferase